MATTEALAATTAALAARTDVALRAICSISFRDFNAYDQMTATSASIKKDSQKKLRTEYFEHCGITMNRDTAKADGKVIAFCVLTGRADSARNLKLAHLVPAATKQDIKTALQLQHEDIWGFRNVLLLSWNIERAFDKCQISFVPNPLHENSYSMKIWDDIVRDTPIWDGAEVLVAGTKDNTIGYYEDKYLNLNMENGITLVPFKRCLSYQNFICFYKSAVVEQPNDFSSELGNPDGWAIQRNNLMSMRFTLERDILLESAVVDNEDI